MDEIVPYATEQNIEDVLKSFQIDNYFIGEQYNFLRVGPIVNKKE